MPMWQPDAYSLDLSAWPGRLSAEKVFSLVWRLDFNSTGFCLLDAAGVDSHTLRSWVADLKQQSSEIAVLRSRQSFAVRSMARSDQQDTTEFHTDGAPDQATGYGRRPVTQQSSPAAWLPGCLAAGLAGPKTGASGGQRFDGSVFSR